MLLVTSHAICPGQQPLKLSLLQLIDRPGFFLMTLTTDVTSSLLSVAHSASQSLEDQGASASGHQLEHSVLQLQCRPQSGGPCS